jgi:hypothetical protein
MMVWTVGYGVAVMSGNDWLQYIHFLFEKTKDPAFDQEEQAEAILEFFDAIDGLAENTTADPEDRWFACDLQANIAALARTLTGTAIVLLSEIARTESGGSEKRSEAQRYLKHVAERLRQQGSDISKWVDPGPRKIHAASAPSKPGSSIFCFQDCPELGDCCRVGFDLLPIEP